MPAQAVVDREFLELRAKILQLAASFDRIERGEGSADSASMELLRDGIRILLEEKPDRAERVQMLFSREYLEDWRKEFDL